MDTPQMSATLNRLIGLLYTATERFVEVEGQVHSWIHPDIAAQLWQAWLDGRESDVVLRASGPAIQKTVSYQSRVDPMGEVAWSGTDNHYLGLGNMDYELMLKPRLLISEVSLASIGTSHIAGRSVSIVRAHRRLQDPETAQQWPWRGPDEFEWAIDIERGVLLASTSFYKKRQIGGEFYRIIKFNDTLPDQKERWDGLARVVSLLYSAQYNFDTVHARTRTWYPDTGVTFSETWAKSPDKFRDLAMPSDWKFLPVFFNPSWLISGLDIDRIAPTVWEVRDAIEMWARPTDPEVIKWHFWSDADHFNLIIDADTGILLEN